MENFNGCILTGRHGDAGSDTTFVFDIYDLVIHDVILALIHAGAIVCSVQPFCDIFNVKNLGVNKMPSPLFTD